MIQLHVKKFASFLEHTRGLIGKSQATSIFFQTRFGIHTFGLRFPIDVVILNNNCEVTFMKENLKPNRIFLWNPKDNNVIELPSRSIEQLHIKRGSKIELLFDKNTTEA